LAPRSFRPAKIQNFESDSQRAEYSDFPQKVPFDRQRYKILKAIHNPVSVLLHIEGVPFDRQRYKILKAIHNTPRAKGCQMLVPFDRQRYKILKAIHNKKREK